MYEFLKLNPQRFPTADLQRLIVGGDSAGAQIASQFAALQTNPELAKSMQLSAVVPKQDLIGAVLIAGHTTSSIFTRQKAGLVDYLSNRSGGPISALKIGMARPKRHRHPPFVM